MPWFIVHGQRALQRGQRRKHRLCVAIYEVYYLSFIAEAYAEYTCRNWLYRTWRRIERNLSHNGHNFP